jgi:hypothetical protein
MVVSIVVDLSSAGSGEFLGGRWCPVCSGGVCVGGLRLVIKMSVHSRSIPRNEKQCLRKNCSSDVGRSYHLHRSFSVLMVSQCSFSSSCLPSYLPWRIFLLSLSDRLVWQCRRALRLVVFGLPLRIGLGCFRVWFTAVRRGRDDVWYAQFWGEREDRARCYAVAEQKLGFLTRALCRCGVVAAKSEHSKRERSLQLGLQRENRAAVLRKHMSNGARYLIPSHVCLSRFKSC